MDQTGLVRLLKDIHGLIKRDSAGAKFSDMLLCDLVQIQTDVDRCVTVPIGQPTITIHE
jgi:hypothetical protein